MPKKRSPALILVPLVLIGGGIAFAYSREAKAKEPDVKPGPVDRDEVDTNGDAKRAEFKERPTYEASATVCFRDGQPYNQLQWPDPAAVVAGLQRLGFPIGLVELLQSDAAAPRSPMWVASGGYQPATSDKLRQFQAMARSMNLPGYAGAPARSVDGVIGECTLRSMSAALELVDAGSWPIEPVVALTGMAIG